MTGRMTQKEWLAFALGIILIATGAVVSLWHLRDATVSFQQVSIPLSVAALLFGALLIGGALLGDKIVAGLKRKG